MIWGMDTSSTITGWCAGDGSTAPIAGAWRFDDWDTDLGGLAIQFDDALNRLALRFPPTWIVYEEPIMTKYDRLLVVRKLYGLGFWLEGWARRNSVPIREESAKGIKKHLTGNHLATKDTMVAHARAMGIELPPVGTKDAADAFGAWLIGVQAHAKPHLPHWDRLRLKSRGALL